MADPVTGAVTREYRKVQGQKCAACEQWQSGGVFAIFEPHGVALRVCGFLCQSCAKESGVPIYPATRSAGGAE